VIAESVVAGEAIALAQKEEDLLEATVREYSRLVYRIAFSVLRKPEEAEDATQETFLRIVRFSKKLAKVQDRKAWLARIAWRVAIEHRKRLPEAGMVEATEGLLFNEAVAEKVVLNQEHGAILERLMLALPDALRDPLILSTVEELSPAEAAAVLDISEAAVRSRIFRARQILRERLLGLMGPRK
jgi:RNA polymerase sigma-70 factor (ECF subfamily)